MKNKLIFIFLITFSIKLFAFESVLIDFDNLQDTTIDFSKRAGDFWSEEEKKQMIIDLSVDNWMIRVNRSSWNKESRDKSRILEVTKSLNYPGTKLLGIRIFFPQRYANSHAEIIPPFQIPAFYESMTNPDGKGQMFLNKGVIRNVGIIRSISVRFLGNNFNYGLYLRIINQDEEEKDIFIGYMNFVGWKTKIWINPNIEEELKLRDLQRFNRPYYPDEETYIKFVGFIIQRTHPEVTGNFVTMIKDVTVEYDEAFLELGKAEYNQEEIFGIYKEELSKRAETIMRNVDTRIYHEWVEKQRMHKDYILLENSQ